MSDAPIPTTAAPAPPDPSADRGGKPLPERLAEVLAVVQILTAYGRYLLNLLERPALWRGFATVAQFFGTGSVAAILPYVQRGIMRAVALERALLARAEGGRDLAFLAPRAPAARRPKPAATCQPDGGATGQAEVAAISPAAAAAMAQLAALFAPAAADRPARRRRDEPLTFDTIPSMAELEAEARRRPIGPSITAICRDLGLSFRLCERMFGIRLFDTIRRYRGSLGAVVQEMRRREKRFDKELWRHPGLELPEQTEAGMRRVLGFFVGEPMVDPFSPAPAPGALVAAAATGPP